MTEFEEISLSNDKYFELFIGKRVLKKDLWGKEENEIPLYSANIFKPFGYVKKSNISDFSNDFVLWGIDGNFEFNLIKKDNKFATTDHCGTIRIKDNNLIPEYIVYSLYLARKKHGLDRSLRSSLENMGKKIKLKIPIVSYDEKNHRYIFDKDYQLKIAKKFNLLNEMKDKISSMKIISDSKVTFNFEKIKSKKVTVEDIFDMPPTNSKITKKFCFKNKGHIPVYGCSKEGTSTLGYIKDNLLGVRYYENSISYNRNGSVGFFFYRRERYSTNEDHRVLSLKEGLKDCIDLEYMKYLLEIVIREMGYEFTNKLGKEKIRSIYISIPINKNGNFDLSKQKNMASKLKEISSIKKDLEMRLNDLTDYCSNIDLLN